MHSIWKEGRRPQPRSESRLRRAGRSDCRRRSILAMERLPRGLTTEFSGPRSGSAAMLCSSKPLARPFDFGRPAPARPVPPQPLAGGRHRSLDKPPDLDQHDVNPQELSGPAVPITPRSCLRPPCIRRFQKHDPLPHAHARGTGLLRRPGSLNRDWRSGYADSKPLWLDGRHPPRSHCAISCSYRS
jgi:hypothetical protein